MSQDMTVANNIAEQIGHRAFMMLGAKDKFGGENYLQFKIQGSRKVNAVRVELDPSDTYTVKFYKVNSARQIIKGAPAFDLVAEVSDIYADGLCSVIEAKTGLYTSL